MDRLKRIVHDTSIRNQELRAKLEYACNIGVQTILIREGVIGDLKKQMRLAGVRPFNDPVDDDVAWENEMMMLFRMLCCWAKRFYKFPTTMEIPRHLQMRISKICEDRGSECLLISSQNTKYLIIVAIAARWLVKEIMDLRFLESVARDFDTGDEGLQALLDGAQGIFGHLFLTAICQI